MAGDEVDRVARAAALALVEVGTAGDARGQGRHRAGLAAQEGAHVVAEAAVPLGPAAVRGETAHLVEAGRVPGLGDDLGVGEHRVLGDHLHHRRVGEHAAVPVAAEDRGQVEAEPVHVHVHHPPAERIHDQFADDHVVAVAGVAAAGKVEVGAGPGVEQVVDGVVDAAEAGGRAVAAALGGVIVDDVEDHLDAGPVQGLDHVAELVQRRLRVAAVGRLGGEEGERAVAPEVFQPLAGERVDKGGLVLVELGDRHEFHRGDSQVFEIGDLFDDPAEGAGVFDPGRGVTGEAAHVQFVNDRVLQGDAQRPVALPVVAMAVDQAAGLAAQAGARVAPGGRVDLAGVGVEQDAAAVKGMAAARGVVGAAQPVAVAQVVRCAGEQGVPDVTGAVAGRVERELAPPGPVAAGDHQRDRLGVAREQGKIDAVRGHRAAVGQG